MFLMICLASCLLHSWFYIDITTAKTNPFDFPPQVHADKKGLPIPALFIGSTQFSQWKGLADTTNRLIQSSTGAVGHVLDESRHQNFTDVGFWLPVWLLRRFKALGACDYHDTHTHILNLTHDFLQNHTK